MSRGALTLAALLGLLAAPAARAHEVLHAVERNRAVAVRAYFADGEPLAYARYEIFSPSDPRIPHQKGRTDRSGWLAFVPDAPGRWRVRAADDSGHGFDVEVEAGEGPATGPSGAAFALRPLVGLAAIGAVFAVLFAAYRRTRSTP